jgi:hypothetical protein
MDKLDLTKDENKRTPGNFMIIALNSTGYFILAFFFVYLSGQLATAIAAMQFDYTGVVYYYKLVYTIDTYAWISDAVKMLYSIAPFTALLIALLSIIAILNMYADTSGLKLFFLWTYVHGIVWFFGAILAGTFLDKGFGYVIMYLYFMDTGKLVLSLLSLTGLLVALGLSTKYFIFSANTYFNKLTEHSRTFFIFSQVFLPVIAGTIIIIGIKLPEITIYELFVLISTLFIILPVSLLYNSYPTFYFEEWPVRIRLNLPVIITAIVVLVAFRIIFEAGIPFGTPK